MENIIMNEQIRIETLRKWYPTATIVVYAGGATFLPIDMKAIEDYVNGDTYLDGLMGVYNPGNHEIEISA